MLEVYLLRHGIAEETSRDGRDSERALTAEGKRKLRLTLKRALRGGAKPSLILSSPYRRAIETAEVAAQILGCAGGVLRTDALKPAARPEDVWAEIRAHRTSGSLLLAGHEPLFSAATAYLLDSPGLRVDFKKGAVVRIDFESVGPAPRGCLRWMLTPSLSA
jgi:phosphohistidine phosphatase